VKVTWSTPISLSFERGSRNVIPCGSRHPSNLTDDAKPYDTSVFDNIPIIDGERVDLVGNVKVNTSFDGCKFSGIEIVKISFEEVSLKEPQLRLSFFEWLRRSRLTRSLAKEWKQLVAL